MSKSKHRPSRRAPPLVEELEPRVLFSADLAGALSLTEAATTTATMTTTTTATTDSQLMQAAQVAAAQTSAATAASARRVELVFVDSAVANAAQLVRDLQAQRGDGRTLQVFTIDASQDGLRQISAVLKHYQGDQAVDAIHLITHGDAQGLRIGSTWLSQQNLADYAKQVASWSLSLHAHADLMLYGCDLAASTAGQQLANDLGLLTGADVAASTNVTGSAAAGGDWTLEYSKGRIESHVAADTFTQADWNGTLLLTSSGGESLVNTTTSGTQTTVTNRQVATDSSGNYVAVWQNGATLYGQRFNSSGVKQGGEFTMATSGALFATVNNPQVAMNASGAFAVTWYEYNPGILGILLPSWTVYMQRFNAAGASQGVTTVFGNLSLLSFPSDPQMYSSIAIDGGGNTAVATRSGSEVDIGWFNSSGSQTGSARADSGNGNTKDQVSVSLTSAGSVVTWTESGTEIYGQLYNASHVAVGGNFHVNTTTSGNQTQSSVGMDSTGAFVVSWTGTQGGTNDIFAQRFSNTGAKVGAEFQVNNTSTDSQLGSSVAVDGSGAFLIAWQSNLQDGSGTGIYVRQYQSDGCAGLFDQLVNTTTSGAQSTPSVAFSGSQAVVVWNGNGAGDTAGIFAQRLSVGSNQAPTLALSTSSLNYVENAGAVVLDGGMTLADVDNSTLQGATLQITGNYVNGEDLLQFTNAFGIVGTWNAATGALTLSGTSLKSNYQQALRSVTYLDNSDNPSAAVRTVSVSVTDGQLASGVATESVAVQAVNDAPTLSAPAVLSVIQDTPTVISGITVADVDAGAGLVTLTLTAASGTFSAASTGLVTVSGGGTAVLALQGQIADLNNFIAASAVSYTTVLGGTGAVGLNLTIDDGGNTGSGGAKTASWSGALSTVVVTPPTVSAPASVSVVEDAPSAVTGLNVVANDAGSHAIQLTLTVGAGSLSATSGAGVTVSQTQADTLVLVGNAANLDAFIAAGQVSYLTVANANGSVALNVVLDDLQQSYPGLNLYGYASASLAITAVNDAPQGTSNTVTTLEDHDHVFTAADFGFSDPADNPANQFAGVLVTSLPVAGTLTLDVAGVATVVSPGQLISKTDLDAGKLVFTPAADANGAAYASFTFQVKDNGGTANGGIDLDPTPRSLTIDVTPVNDAPQGADHTAVLLEDGSYTFSVPDFGFSDPQDTPANALQGVVVSSLPGAGILTLSGVAVQSGDFISAANLGNLVYTPEPNGSGAAHASFTFRVRDNGGTANGGLDTDQTPRTMTLSVTPVNDAPQASDGSVSLVQSSNYTFQVTDFGFRDALDNPPNQLLEVRIVSLPGAGLLTLSGAPVTAAQIVLASDVAAGRLVFAPTAGVSGQAYAHFTFQVRDNGGTANGGVDWDANVHTLTINVNAPAVSAVVVESPASPTPPVEATSVPTQTPTQATTQAAARTAPTATQLAPRAAPVAAGPGHFGEFAVRSAEIRVVETAYTLDGRSGRAQPSRGYDADLLRDAAKVTPIQWLLDQIHQQRLARGEDGLFAAVSSNAVHWSPDVRDDKPLQTAQTVVRSGGVVASVGAVWWATRLSGLMTGVMASTPAWRTLDPLPILGKSDAGAGGSADDGDDDFDATDHFDEDADGATQREPGARRQPYAADLFAQAPDTHGRQNSGGTL